MGFLGAIGHLMSGSGLEEVLKSVCAPNTVPKTLEGKAISRAIRGHFLVDGALNTLLAAKTFQVPLPIPASYAVDSENRPELSEDGTVADDSEDSDTTRDEPVSDQPEEEHTDHDKDLPEILAEASDLYDSVMSGTTTTTNGCKLLKVIGQCLEAEKTTMVNDRTAALWLQYMEMIDIHHIRENWKLGSAP